MGIGGTRGIRVIESDWLNVDDRVGYVVRRQSGRPNVMRYHDETGGSGRVPKLQEWLSLVGDPELAPAVDQDWACVITCLNRSAPATAQLAETASFEVDADRAVCQVSGIEVRVDFTAPSVTLLEP